MKHLLKTSFQTSFMAHINSPGRDRLKEFIYTACAVFCIVMLALFLLFLLGIVLGVILVPDFLTSIV